MLPPQMIEEGKRITKVYKKANVSTTPRNKRKPGRPYKLDEKAFECVQ
ncbi:MAG: hypothetical protein ACPLN2_00665 [Thermoproteota archaeon]